jgi:hypothetical protein
MPAMLFAAARTSGRLSLFLIHRRPSQAISGALSAWGCCAAWSARFGALFGMLLTCDISENIRCDMCAACYPPVICRGFRISKGADRQWLVPNLRVSAGAMVSLLNPLPNCDGACAHCPFALQSRVLLSHPARQSGRVNGVRHDPDHLGNHRSVGVPRYTYTPPPFSFS